MKVTQKYIKLTGLTDKNGQQCRVMVNTERMLGIEERYGQKFGGGVQTDKQGYPKIYSEVITKGKSFFVLESVEEIYDKIYGYDVAKRIAKREVSARSSLEHQSDTGSLFD
jgi:hypothetical protein